MAGRCPINEVPIRPFVGLMLLVVLLPALIPGLATFLPRLTGRDVADNRLAVRTRP